MSEKNTSVLPPPYRKSTVDVESGNSRIEENKDFSREQRKIRCCCCICGPCVQYACGGFWIIIILLLVILGPITLVNFEKCRKLDFDKVDPSTISYEPSVYPNLTVETRGTFWSGRVDVRQSNSSSATNATIRSWIASSKSGPKVSSSIDGSVYKVTVSTPDYYSWLGYWHVPPRCAKARIEIELPQNLPRSQVSVSVENFDITVSENSAALDLDLNTDNGDISLNSVSVGSVRLGTDNGNIGGLIAAIQDRLTAKTDNGDVDLRIHVSPNATDPQIDTSTDNGDVTLRFDNTFSGRFDLTVDNGDISTSGFGVTSSSRGSGRVGAGNKGQLRVGTDNGDIRVEF